MKKFTDKQLSIILGEADARQLIEGGMDDWGFAEDTPVGCINQAAYNEPNPQEAMNINTDAAKWFDGHPRMQRARPGTLLRAMVKKRLA